MAFHGLPWPSLTLSDLPLPSIAFRTGAMAFDSCQVADDSRLAHTLQRIDHVAVSVFIAELVAKVIAYGFLLTPNAYLKEPWNRLDFFIVSASIVSMVSLLPLANASFSRQRSFLFSRDARPTPPLTHTGG